MPSEATWNGLWLISSAVGFLGWTIAFAMLVLAVRRQYAIAQLPMTGLASALVRQKAALAVFGAAFCAVFGTAAGTMVWGWEIPFWWRMAYRSVAFLAAVAVPILAYLVVLAMDKDARNLLHEKRTDAHRQMIATERIADQGDALAQAGVDDRHATATERIADASEGLFGGRVTP